MNGDFVLLKKLSLIKTISWAIEVKSAYEVP